MSSQQDQLSSARDYQREAEATRRRLANSLDELTDRLTPGQVLDEVMTYAKGGGGTFFRALSNATRASPIPSLLIGAGCMMFLSEKMGFIRSVTPADSGEGARSKGGETNSEATSRRTDAASRAADRSVSAARSAADSVRDRVQSAARFASEQTSSAADAAKGGAAAIGDAVSSAAQSARESANSLRDRAATAADQIKNQAQSISDSVGEYSSTAREQIAASGIRGRDQALRSAGQVRDKAFSFINEQPLLCAALGLAVGAAISALLPSTTAENQLLGETSDAVKNAVGKAASEQLGTAKDAAARVAQQAKTAAEAEGLSGAGVADAARTLADKVQRVVTETASTGAAEVEAQVKADDRSSGGPST